MKAIILAAGIGKRLAQTSGGRPKCLLEIGGISLLQRHLATLKRYAVHDVFIVSGYRSVMIADALHALSSSAHILFNPDYLQGSIVSLWTARKVLLGTEGVILMDADVLYDETLLFRLLDSSHPNCLLLDRVFEGGEEPVKVYIRDNQVIAFGKKIATDLTADLIGESVGFFKFCPAMATQLLNCTKTYINDKKVMLPHEDVIRTLLLRAPGEFGYEDITGLPWIEIDFPTDVAAAKDTVLPAISR